LLSDENGKTNFRPGKKTVSNQNLEIRDTDHVLCVLRQSVRAFLSEFGGDGEISKNRLLIRLKDFSEKEFQPVYNAAPEKNSDMNSELRAA